MSRSTKGFVKFENAMLASPQGSEAMWTWWDKECRGSTGKTGRSGWPWRTIEGGKMERIRREDVPNFCLGFGGSRSPPRFVMVSRSPCDFQASISPALRNPPLLSSWALLEKIAEGEEDGFVPLEVTSAARCGWSAGETSSFNSRRGASGTGAGVRPCSMPGGMD